MAHHKALGYVRSRQPLGGFPATGFLARAGRQISIASVRLYDLVDALVNPGFLPSDTSHNERLRQHVRSTSLLMTGLGCARRILRRQAHDGSVWGLRPQVMESTRARSG
jgi:hypothetical protein